MPFVGKPSAGIMVDQGSNGVIVGFLAEHLSD